MAAALRLLAGGSLRDLWLYATYEGTTDATDADVRARDGLSAEEHFASARAARSSSRSDWFWAEATLDDVRTNLATTGYPPERIHLVPGPVEDTIPEGAPDRIALLRLDTAWYESTRDELDHLFPPLQPGGIRIVDDYSLWRESHKAVDECFSKRGRTPCVLQNRHKRCGDRKV